MAVVPTIENELDKQQINFYFFNRNIHLNFSIYSDKDMDNELKNIFKSFYIYSEVFIVGFESEIFIDEYPGSLYDLVTDKSLYPLYFSSPLNFEKIIYRLSNSIGETEKMIELVLNQLINEPKIEDINTNRLLELRFLRQIFN